MRGKPTTTVVVNSSEKFHSNNLTCNMLEVKNMNIYDKIQELIEIINEQKTKISELEEKLNSIVIEEN